MFSIKFTGSGSGRIITILFIGSVLCLSTSHSKAQIPHADSLMAKTEEAFRNLMYRNHDTSYIASYADELALKVLGVNKYTYFQLNDKNLDSKLRYRPDRQINLGFGVAYKWFAIDLAFDVGISEDSELDSKFFDFQGRVFTSKQNFEGTYQYYYGYKANQVFGIGEDLPDSASVRNDIRTINLGLQYLYAFNYGRFSLKASFVSNEVQKKSAGSTIGGISFNQYVMDADSSVIPTQIRDDFSSEIYLQDLNVASLGVSFGYMYSFIYRKMFLTLGIIPGVSLNFGDYKTQSRHDISPNLSLRFRTMNAIGWNGRRFFTGIKMMGNLIPVRIGSGLTVDVGQGNAKVFAGWRFENKNKK